MKNPLSRARSRSEDAPDESAADETVATDAGGADDAWSAYRPDDAPVDDAPGDDVPVDPAPVAGAAPVDDALVAGDAPVDADGDGEPSVPLAARLAGLLGATRRAQLVVVAVALLIGPSAGAGVRATLAAAVPRPTKPAPVEVEREPGGEGTDETVATVDDGRRRYLVALSPRTATTTTAAQASAATTTTVAATATTGVAPTRATTPATLPPSPFPVTIVAGEETQWADVVRLDGSRVVVLLPTRYLRLVPESDPARATFALTPERSLVKDRDGRYWATARDGMDAALYELPGQLPPAPVRESTHEEESTHEDTTHEGTAHEESTDHATTGTTHGAAATGHAATTDTHGSSTSDDGHGTEAAHTALPTIPRSTTTTLPPAPPALVEPVPLADRETAILLASLPGVEEVKALGPGVFAVIGILDPADLEAVPGVASVREDAGWRTPS